MKIDSVHIIDRSDPHETVAVGEKGKITRLQMLQGKHGIIRTDIALINVTVKCPTCGSKDYWKQFCVYATESGEPRGDGWQHLTDEQKDRCREINRKLIEVAKEHTEMGYYLH